MNITFTAIGLTFEAEVDYTPGTPGRYYGPPENCYPDEPSETEITALTVDGNDAMFLLDSSLRMDIEQAAEIAADEAFASAADEAEISRYEGRCYE